MAIEYVGGKVAGRANPSAALAVNIDSGLTGGIDTAARAGDLVIVAVVTGSSGGTPAMAVTTPSGYTAIGQENQNDTADTSMDVSWKIMPATPDTTVTIPGTTNNAWGEAYSIQVFRGVDPTTPMDVAAVHTGGIDTGRPNPPSINWSTSGTWVVICGGGAAGTGANYTAPANYTTDFLTASGADTTDAMVGSGYNPSPADPEDPAVYTGGTTGTGDSWAAYTLALRPAPEDQSVTGGTRSTAVAANAPSAAYSVVAAAIAATALFAPSASYRVVNGFASPATAIHAPEVAHGGGAQAVTGATRGTAVAANPPTLSHVVVGPTRGTAVVVNAPSTSYQVVGPTRSSAVGANAPTVTPGAVTIVGAHRGTAYTTSVPTLRYVVAGPTRGSAVVANPPSTAYRVAGPTRGAAVTANPPTARYVVAGPTRASSLSANPPTVAVGAVTIVGAFRGTAYTTGVPTVTQGGIVGAHISGTTTTAPRLAYVVVGPTRASEVVANAPTVSPGAVTIVLPHRGSSLSIGSPTLGYAILGPTRGGAASLGAPSVTAGPVTIVVGHVAGTTLGAPLVSGGVSYTHSSTPGEGGFKTGLPGPTTTTLVSSSTGGL